MLFHAVDTPRHKENPPIIISSTHLVVDEILIKMEKDKEIQVSDSKLLYAISRIAPNLISKK